MSHAKPQSRKKERADAAPYSFVPSCLRVRKFFAPLRLCVRSCGFLVLALLGLGMTAFAEDPFPKDWSPDLDEVTARFRDELKNAHGQQEINRLSGRLAEVRDGQLALVYIQLWQKLSPKEQASLKKEQTAWIQQREESAKKASLADERGSLALHDYCEDYIKITDLRIKELQKRLKQRPSIPSL